MIEKDIEKVLISKEEIFAKSAELGKQLTEEYQGKILSGRYFKRCSTIYG